MNPPTRFPGPLLVGFGIVVVLLVAPVLAFAGPGDPDRSFGSGGVAKLSRNDTVLRAGAVQRDGKLVAVGEQGGSAGSVKLLVVRFNRGGSLDQSFARSGGLPLLGGSGGIYLGGVGTTATAVAIQRDGRIVVAGRRTDRSGAALRGMLVMRLKANGTPDRSFSGDGVATALVGRNGEANAVAIRGKRIVVAGGATLGTARADAFSRVAVARFRANGSHDTHFGSHGARVFDFGRLSLANGVAIRRDRSILLVGSQRDNLQSTSLLAARLTPGGARDRGFSGDGVFIHQYARGAAYSAAFDLLPARHGKIIAAGVASSASAGPKAIALRLTSGGRPDRGFSGDGVAYLRAASDPDQYDKIGLLAGAYGIAQAGKRIVLAGSFDSLGLKRLALWALKGNGRPARGFGKGGRTVTPAGQASAQLNDLALAPGGKLYGVGALSNFVDPSTGLAARYQGG
jgi:uncharacterized delta-60 repeat protein